MALLLEPKRKQSRGEPARLDNLERFAWLMDRAVGIPGTNIRFGLDSLIGLFPFGGDALMGLIQAGLVGVALTRYNVPKSVAARMIFNVLLDMGVGSIPILGDLFDVAFKANTRNVALLRQARDHEEKGEPMPAKPSRRWLVSLGVGFLIALALMVAGLVVLFLWAMKALLGHPLI